MKDLNYLNESKPIIMKNEIQITKIKLSSDGTLQINYDEIVTTDEEPVINHVIIAGGHTVHQDMRDAIARLTIHGAIICEQIKTTKAGKGQTAVMPSGEVMNMPIKIDADQLKILESCQVYGFSIGGDDEKPGAVLNMKRRLSNGQTIVINTPFSEFEKKNGYKYRSKLAEDIEAACQEAILYLEGKKAPDPQLSMFNESNQ